MAHYPINLDLKGRRCVVIGGGIVAERKVKTLLEFGAAVTVVSPELTPRLSEWANAGTTSHSPDTYRPGMLDDAFLVIAATDDREVNRAVSEEARAHGILVNVVDDPELCSFFLPAVVRRGDFLVSVSTSGRSPALSKSVREYLEKLFGPEYGELADLLGELREEVRARYTDQSDRMRAYNRIIDSNVLDLLRQGRRDEALETARKCI